MRRILCILAAGLFLLCCGCQNARITKESIVFPRAFSATLHITHRETEFDAVYTRAADGTATTCLQSPEAVRSLEIVQTANTCQFRFLGLELKTPEALLPDAAFAKLLYAALESAESGARCVVTTHGESLVYSGMTEAGDAFTLTRNAGTGALETLTVDGQKLSVTFSDFQITA